MVIKIKYAVVFLTILSILPLAVGCWDRVEIDERSFVLGVAIDKAQDGEKNETEEPNEETQDTAGEEQDKESEDSENLPRYKMTYEIPIIKNIGSGGSEQGGGGGGGDETHWLPSTTADSLWDAERYISDRSSRIDFYGHLKAIIISDEIAREGIGEIIDAFTRRREVHNRVQLLISNGEARKILDIEPKEENWSSLYLERIFLGKQRFGAHLSTDLLEIRKSLVATGSAVVPRVRAGTDEVTAAGAAVIKDWKFAGWLSEHEVSGFNLITSDDLKGNIPVVDPQTEEGIINVTLTSFNKEINVSFEEDIPTFKVKITMDNDIVERGSSNILWNVSLLDQLERRLELEAQRRVYHVVNKMQDEFQADIFGFHDLLSRKYPDYWQEVQEEWDDKYFPRAKLSVEVDAKVRRTGAKL